MEEAKKTKKSRKHALEEYAGFKKWKYEILLKMRVLGSLFIIWLARYAK